MNETVRLGSGASGQDSRHDKPRRELMLAKTLIHAMLAALLIAAAAGLFQGMAP